MQYVYETALKMGIQPRPVINDFQEAEPFLEMGIKHFGIGWELQIVHDWCKEQGAALAKLVGK